MPTVIVKFERVGHEPRYLLYSSIVDAPVSRGMRRDDFLALCDERGYGSPAVLQKRMERADAKGTSCRLSKNARGAILCNRAGPNETELSYEEMWDHYCADDRADTPSARTPQHGAGVVPHGPGPSSPHGVVSDVRREGDRGSGPD